MITNAFKFDFESVLGVIEENTGVLIVKDYL